MPPPKAEDTKNPKETPNDSASKDVATAEVAAEVADTAEKLDQGVEVS